MEEIRAVYFGCYRDVGHYFWLPGMRMMPWAYEIGLLPWEQIDACLCPGYVEPYRTPDSVQHQSEAALHFKDGWAALAMWDKTVDSRPASNSAFLLRGEHDFDDMCMCFKAAFTTVWDRINKAAPIVLANGENNA